MYLISKDHLPL
ncbi:unnamed protein product, partial [Rotaria socialis]